MIFSPLSLFLFFKEMNHTSSSIFSQMIKIPNGRAKVIKGNIFMGVIWWEGRKKTYKVYWQKLNIHRNLVKFFPFNYCVHVWWNLGPTGLLQGRTSKSILLGLFRSKNWLPDEPLWLQESSLWAVQPKSSSPTYPPWMNNYSCKRFNIISCKDELAINSWLLHRLKDNIFLSVDCTSCVCVNAW